MSLNLETVPVALQFAVVSDGLHPSPVFAVPEEEEEEGDEDEDEDEEDDEDEDEDEDEED